MSNTVHLLNMAESFQRVRRQTVALSEGLSAEDMLAQSMPDASPAKWHLAHTTWFFEHFIAQRLVPGYKLFHPEFSYLFNSYYKSEGVHHARPDRGLLTRPALDSIWHYRTYVEEALLNHLAQNSPIDDIFFELMTLGLHHEMQHQELLLTDVLHLFSRNPLWPAVQSPRTPSINNSKQTEPVMHHYDGGLVEIGANPNLFFYDCEAPRHKVWLEPYQLANRPINNREWLSFMADGGYRQPLLWLADGWNCRQENGWNAPLYWHEIDNQWHQFGLDGLQPINWEAPVCHISFYEADAFARWAGKRLPTEAQWEHAAEQDKGSPFTGKENFMEERYWRPIARQDTGSAPQGCDFMGNVWEWTRSPYLAYPGFHPKQGALGEYNGKFMANQWVLRGGSCATPREQMRISYRNFFYPHQRWQFSGVRLAD